MRLDPTSLRLFVRVVETGTIAAAAEREHIAASAVSKRLSELEQVLQTVLLQRSNKGIEPTAAGIALLNLARGVLHDLDDIQVQMRDFSSGTRGFVRIFANISAITQFLPRQLKSFLDEHPHVHIHLEEKISSEITRGVAESAADIGIFTSGVYGQDLEIFPYQHDELVVIVPAEHPLVTRESVTFQEILDYEFIGLHTGSAINLLLIKNASELNRSLKVRMQVTSYDALCLMVEAGLGIGILPKSSARPALASLGIRVLWLEEDWAQRSLSICVRSYPTLSVAARLLVDHLGHSGHPA